jgi:hypothetical protein
VKRILFVTWDGPQSTYLEGLFLPILAGLAKSGFAFSVLQFTWGDQAASDSAARACAAHAIAYRRIDVWRAGAPGALASAVAGGRQVDRAIADWRIDAVMPRSLMPALAVMLAPRGRNLPMIFDADGLPADERVDHGALSSTSPVYRLFRLIERRATMRSQAVLVRTSETIPVLAERAALHPEDRRFHVVSNGRDPAPFFASPSVAADPERPRLCYLGSVGPQYEPARMLRLVTALRNHLPGLQLEFFTGDLAAAHSVVKAAGLDPAADWLRIARLPADAVASGLARQDIGLAPRASSLSMSAVSPIKLGDYMLAGMPVIGSGDVGPVAPMLEAGCLMPDDQSLEAIAAFVRNVLDNRETMRQRCRTVGLAHFSFARSITDYEEALRVL